jgi:large subunit ribosomal protein L13
VKSQMPEFILNSARPERVFQKAVERMLPKESPLARDQFAKLHVYAGSEHPHAGQKPETYDFATKNPKNKR